MRKLHFARATAAWAALLVALGCDPGRVEVVFMFDGPLPVYPPQVPATATIRVETRIDPRKPGREIAPSISSPYGPSEIVVPEIPYGSNRVIIGEIRAAPTEEQVDYYGISEPFEVQRGDHLRVPVLLQPRSPPQLLPSEAGPSLVIVSSSVTPGYVRGAEVQLLLYAEESAEKVRVSNVIGLPEEKSVVLELAELPAVEAPAGYRGHRARWRLDRFAEPCPTPGFCRREVFARFIDAQEYASPPVSAAVVLDEVPPGLVPELVAVSPRVARRDTPIVVSLTATEFISPPRLRVARSDAFVLRQVSPAEDEDGLSATYTFTSTQVAGALGRDGEFEVWATLTDIAGNRARDVVVGKFQLDTKPPGLAEVSVSPEHVGLGDVVTARFRLDEDLRDGGRLEVSFAGELMACMETGAAPAIDVTCSHAITGREAEWHSEVPQPVLVEATDVAGNVTRAPSPVVRVDFRAPSVLPGSASVQLVAGRDNPLHRLSGPPPVLTEATIGTAVFVSFVLDEAIQAPPKVTASGGALEFRALSHAGAAHVFQMVLERGAYAQGAQTVEVVVTDDVGNSASHRLELPRPGFVIDTEPPPAPDTLRIVHRRHPWGDIDPAADTPWATVEGEEAAVEANTVVAVLLSPSLAEFSRIAEVRADRRGGFARVPLDLSGDAREVYVVALDAAGNPSRSTSGVSGTASRVRRGVWTASLRGKIAGQRTPNPHDARRIHGVERSLAQDPEMTSTPGPAELEALAIAGGEALRVETLRRWEEVVLFPHQPSPRESAAMAYDAMRGVSVMFGGRSQTSELLRDTWEWDGRKWSLIPQAQGRSPPAREGHALVYDAKRGRVVMFGGHGLTDTWVFDGRSWSELETTSHPPARQGHALAYDSDRGRVLLFGGQGYSDLWALEGDEWTVLADCTAPGVSCPSPRRGAAVRFEPASDGAPGRLVVIGGAAGRLLPPESDAWAWDGAAWARLQVSLPGREGAALVRDDRRGVNLFFGGRDVTGPHDDLYVDQTQHVRPEGEPLPPPREYAASAWDTRRGQLIIFGGFGESGRFLGDTWVLTGLGLWFGWRDVTPSDERPPAREQPALAYDPVGHKMLMVGGVTSGGDETNQTATDTWSWNGARWKQEPVPPTDARMGHAMVAAGDYCVLLFGGRDAPSGWRTLARPQVWMVERWFPLERSPRICGGGHDDAELPSPRYNFAMASGARGTTLLFGGLAGHDAPLGDTWTWMSSVPGGSRAWARRGSGAQGEPAARSGHALAARGNHFVLFGGTPSEDAAPFSDTWEWDGTTWQARQPQGPQPSARFGHAMVEDKHRGRVVLFGGLDAADELRDTWEWDGQSWTQVATRHAPEARWKHALAYDPDRHRVVLFGGPSAVPNEVWELHAEPEQRPGLELVFDWSTLGVDVARVRSLTAQVTGGGQGYSERGAAQPGAELAIWNARKGRWELLASNQNAPSAPGALSGTLSTPAEVESLVTWGQAIHLQLRSRAGIGGGPGTAELLADGVRLEAVYDLED